MKNLSKIALFAFAAVSFTFASCESKPAGEEATTEEHATEGVEAEGSMVEEAPADTTGVEADTAAQQ